LSGAGFRVARRAVSASSVFAVSGAGSRLAAHSVTASMPALASAADTATVSETSVSAPVAESVPVIGGGGGAATPPDLRRTCGVGSTLEKLMLRRAQHFH